MGGGGKIKYGVLFGTVISFLPHLRRQAEVRSFRQASRDIHPHACGFRVVEALETCSVRYAWHTCVNVCFISSIQASYV